MLFPFPEFLFSSFVMRSFLDIGSFLQIICQSLVVHSYLIWEHYVVDWKPEPGVVKTSKMPGTQNLKGHTCTQSCASAMSVRSATSVVSTAGKCFFKSPTCFTAGSSVCMSGPAEL